MAFFMTEKLKLLALRVEDFDDEGLEAGEHEVGEVGFADLGGEVRRGDGAVFELAVADAGEGVVAQVEAQAGAGAEEGVGFGIFQHDDTAAKALVAE